MGDFKLWVVCALPHPYQEWVGLGDPVAITASKI